MTLELKEFRSKLGKRIEQLRRENGISQIELAAMINKDKQVINRYEKQGANPTAFILKLIAVSLNVTLDELLDFSEL